MNPAGLKYQMCHVMWDCTYHIVLCPKYRKRRIYGQLKNQLGRILNKLLEEQKITKLSGTLKHDHVHLQVQIPPGTAVSHAIGVLKGKSAIRLHNQYGTKKHTTNKHFWSRGYFVRTTWLDVEMINNYIKNQADEDRRSDGTQLDLDF